MALVYEKGENPIESHEARQGWQDQNQRGKNVQSLAGDPYR